MIEGHEEIGFGKKVGGDLYIYYAATNLLPAKIRCFIKELENVTKKNAIHFNVLRINIDSKEISLLFYESILDVEFPSLIKSTFIKLNNNDLSYRQYSKSNLRYSPLSRPKSQEIKITAG